MSHREPKHKQVDVTLFKLSTFSFLTKTQHKTDGQFALHCVTLHRESIKGKKKGHVSVMDSVRTRLHRYSKVFSIFFLFFSERYLQYLSIPTMFGSLRFECVIFDLSAAKLFLVSPTLKKTHEQKTTEIQT